MIEIGNVLVSSEVIDTYFVCDLEACKGACCIEGESGAPIAHNEIELIRDAFQDIQSYLPADHLEYISKNGVMYEDIDHDIVTQIIEGERCVFTCFEKDGSARCAFEKAWNEGHNRSFYKPISCHLFPIRVTELRNGKKALNYSRWYPICEPARLLGEKLGIRLYQFLKEPLERAFGEKWYVQMVEQAELYLRAKTEESNEC